MRNCSAKADAKRSHEFSVHYDCEKDSGILLRKTEHVVDCKKQKAKSHFHEMAKTCPEQPLLLVAAVALHTHLPSSIIHFLYIACL